MVKTKIRYTCSGNGGYNLTKKLQHEHDKTLCFNGLSYLPFTLCVFFWRIQEKAVILHSETRPKDSLTEATLSAKPEGDERREVKSGDGFSENLSRSFPHMYVYTGCK